MKNISLVLAGTALVSSVAIGSEWKSIDEGSYVPSSSNVEEKPKVVEQAPVQQVKQTVTQEDVEKYMASKSRNAWRIGILSSSGTYLVEDSNGNESPEFDLDESGFEIAYGSHIDENPGFDYRSFLRFQYSSPEFRGIFEGTTMMLHGDHEWAYKINQYITPFIGFNGGLGATEFDDSDDGWYLTVQLGLFAGVNGNITDKLGYYIRYGKAIQMIADFENEEIIREGLSPLSLGVSYTF